MVWEKIKRLIIVILFFDLISTLSKQAKRIRGCGQKMILQNCCFEKRIMTTSKVGEWVTEIRRGRKLLEIKG